MSWANEYVGWRFSANGRARPEVDCWGLYRLVVLERMGLELPMWAMVDADDLRAVYRVMSHQQQVETWQQVEESEVKEFDLVLMRGLYTSAIDKKLHGGPLHVGCFVDPWRILHIEQRCDSVLSSFKHERPRVLGLYRHKVLAA